MHEKALSLGEHKSLAGILHDPANRKSEVAFVMSNAGLIHRVGPNRMSVKLARALGAHGFASIRFDISGLGDSLPRMDGLPYHQCRFEDSKSVMDYFEAKMGIRRFVTLGLCTGADLAFRTAVRDPRVVGAVLLDGYCYRTPRYYIHHYWPRLLRWQSWWNVLKRSGLAMQRRRQRSFYDAPAGLSGYVMDLPPRAEAEAMLRQLIARNVKLLFTFSRGQIESYNYASQFGDMYPSVDADKVDVEFWPDMDHTITLLSHQQRLIDAVTRWSRSHFSPTSPIACGQQV